MRIPLKEGIGGEREGDFMHNFTNSVVDEVHPQLSTNRHPMDGALVGAGSKSNN
jgi:hypothetical protein